MKWILSIFLLLCSLHALDSKISYTIDYSMSAEWVGGNYSIYVNLNLIPLLQTYCGIDNFAGSIDGNMIVPQTSYLGVRYSDLLLPRAFPFNVNTIKSFSDLSLSASINCNNHTFYFNFCIFPYFSVNSKCVLLPEATFPPTAPITTVDGRWTFPTLSPISAGYLESFLYGSPMLFSCTAPRSPEIKCIRKFSPYYRSLSIESSSTVSIATSPLGYSILGDVLEFITENTKVVTLDYKRHYVAKLSGKSNVTSLLCSVVGDVCNPEITVIHSLPPSIYGTQYLVRTVLHADYRSWDPLTFIISNPSTNFKTVTVQSLAETPIIFAVRVDPTMQESTYEVSNVLGGKFIQPPYYFSVEDNFLSLNVVDYDSTHIQFSIGHYTNRTNLILNFESTSLKFPAPIFELSQNTENFIIPVHPFDMSVPHIFKVSFLHKGGMSFFVISGRGLLSSPQFANPHMIRDDSPFAVAISPIHFTDEFPSTPSYLSCTSPENPLLTYPSIMSEKTPSLIIGFGNSLSDKDNVTISCNITTDLSAMRYSHTFNLGVEHIKRGFTQENYVLDPKTKTLEFKFRSNIEVPLAITWDNPYFTSALGSNSIINYSSDDMVLYANTRLLDSKEGNITFTLATSDTSWPKSITVTWTVKQSTSASVYVILSMGLVAIITIAVILHLGRFTVRRTSLNKQVTRSSLLERGYEERATYLIAKLNNLIGDPELLTSVSKVSKTGSIEIKSAKYDGKNVIVKALDLTTCDFDAVRAMIDEVYILSKMHHPHISHVITILPQKGNLSVVKENTGRYLMSHYTEVPVKLVMKWLHQVSLAILYLHRRGIVHTTLSEHVVGIDEHDDAVLIDLMYACSMNRRNMIISITNNSPPEAYIGKIDAKTDVYMYAKMVERSLSRYFNEKFEGLPTIIPILILESKAEEIKIRPNMEDWERAFYAILC